MARCPFEMLADLEDELDQIRKWPGLKESKPGIFYFKSQGFLHFHIQDGRRWADVRDGKDWGEEIEIPIQPSQAIRRGFMKEVGRRYRGLCQGENP